MTCKFCGGPHTPPLSGQTGEPRLEGCVSDLAARLALAGLPAREALEARAKAEAEKQIGEAGSSAPVPALEPSPVDLELAAVEPVKAEA